MRYSSVLGLKQYPRNVFLCSPKEVGPSSKLWPGRYTTAVWGAGSSFQLVWNGNSWITCVVSELKHCVEHKNGRNMELMSFTEEEPWWVLHWASLLPAEEWGLNLFSHLLTTNMTFLNPLAQKSHVVKGIAAAGRYTMGQMRAGELCGLRTPLRPGFASCRLHGARPRCPRPAPPRCARLFCELSWLVCVPNTKCWLENPTDGKCPVLFVAEKLQEALLGDC